MKTIFFLLFLLLLVACSIEEEKAQPGESFVTYIDSEGKDIAVQVTLPKEARYDAAPLVIPVSTFFTPQEPTFDKDITGVTDFGFVHITYLWPGKSDPSGAKSEGVYDYGGEDSLKALRDVIHFASGDIPNTNGKYIKELSALPLDTENLGLYAFSHPGIAATNVLALYADELDVKYFVGRENPTSDELYALELGYWDEKNNPVYNPFYSYPENYSPTSIDIDHSTVQWDTKNEAPYFDANGNKELDAGEYVLSDKHPQMFGKLFYSRILLQALEENNAFDTIKRPENLATPELAEELWDFRETVFNYDKINKKIHVMLVFAEKDHVQSVKDKPHIHQAYDGFTNNNIWIRLNPDAVYASSMDASLTTPDNDANTEPKDWLEIESWAHTNKVPAAKRIPLAAIAEMADRVHTNNWDKNINELLI
ncbi:MAG TPA: hypothetical protein HA360_05435 [Nanoarchaeota archaeon]|nr:hypothetical protein [Candidatus Woesearchaeota archaeon]HIH14934.1 hypothetical protein [Nanoarchaeota archaeon]HIH58417.1 hypothetical protein [Nanoarchaeota archaeon]HII14490.1 hypothetical protein [Nanoarchaeota archaeon]HIJ05642.1 hypothetical protein [Nanoarchaeota archaeon]